MHIRQKLLSAIALSLASCTGAQGQQPQAEANAATPAAEAQTAAEQAPKTLKFTIKLGTDLETFREQNPDLECLTSRDQTALCFLKAPTGDACPLPIRCTHGAYSFTEARGLTSLLLTTSAEGFLEFENQLTESYGEVPLMRMRIKDAMITHTGRTWKMRNDGGAPTAVSMSVMSGVNIYGVAYEDHLFEVAPVAEAFCQRAASRCVEMEP